MEKLKPELEAMKERVGREAQRRGLDKQAATQMYREEAQKLTKEHQVRPIRSLLVPFTQVCAMYDVCSWPRKLRIH